MKAIDRIDYKEKNILYRKQGGKYVQVNDPCAYEGLGEGWYLVHVRPGCTSIRSTVYPARAEIDTAIREKAEKVEQIILKATQARPKTREMSSELRKDWEALIAKHGKDLSMFEYQSISDMSEEIIRELTSK